MKPIRVSPSTVLLAKREEFFSIASSKWRKTFVDKLEHARCKAVMDRDAIVFPPTSFVRFSAADFSEIVSVITSWRRFCRRSESQSG